MSALSVKTRSQGNAEGLPRVYFSCHPDDFSPYFNLLCDDIFQTISCAVYYDADGHVPEEDLWEALDSMQLFVIPITSRYLLEDSRSLCSEYRFAMEHHIPILAITMEPKLEERFTDRLNKISPGYGGIMLLKHCPEDSSEIPYTRKLAGFLQDILVGDELAQKVRAAFDAYLFLSYRKKDRKYAKELMQLVHRIPICRRMAIWYDEYLVPGELWSKNIMDAMVKSACVLLAVTPNITEEKNYVIAHEYPEAVEQGKCILPVELLPTNTEELRKHFPGISDPVDRHDVERFSAALESALAEFAQQIKNPEGNYLVGLAYVSGIDVEQDPKMGVSLLTEAAEDGLCEAMDKLGVMYLKGQGVSIDTPKALEWFQKAMEREYAPAARHIADMYYEGWGVRKSYYLARKYYVSAAAGGDLAAQYEVHMIDHEHQELYMDARAGDEEAKQKLNTLFQIVEES